MKLIFFKKKKLKIKKHCSMNIYEKGRMIYRPQIVIVDYSTNIRKKEVFIIITS